METGSGGARAPGPGVGAGRGVDESTRRESSSSAAPHAMGTPVESVGGGGGLVDICGEVFERLIARGLVEAVAVESVAAFRSRLEAHFARLPARRLTKLEMLKRRGKGPPKKGQGRRAVKRSK